MYQMLLFITNLSSFISFCFSENLQRSSEADENKTNHESIMIKETKAVLRLEDIKSN